MFLAVNVLANFQAAVVLELNCEGEKSMKIQCRDRNCKEEVNLRLFVKIICGAAVGDGIWVWVAYLFAGTGFVLPLCIAIITSDAAMLIFKDEIVKWLKGMYPFPKCGKEKSWDYLV